MIIAKEDLQRLRREAGITQEELADEVGVSQPYIARLERGTLDPKLSIVNKITDVLSSRTSKTCGEVMSPSPETVNARDPVSLAVSIMKEGNYSQLPVLRGGSAIGYITERDIIRNLNLELEAVSVETVMNPSGVPVVDELTSINAIIPLFQSYQAVIIQKHGRLSGIITRSDLLRLNE